MTNELTRWTLLDDGLEPDPNGAFIRWRDVVKMTDGMKIGTGIRIADLEEKVTGLKSSIDEWETLANKLHSINADLLAACRHAIKVLAVGDDHPSMLVTQLQEAIEKAEGHANP